MNRETVGRYFRLSKPAISITGTGVGRRSRCEAFPEDPLKTTIGLRLLRRHSFNQPSLIPSIHRTKGEAMLHQSLCTGEERFPRFLIYHAVTPEYWKSIVRNGVVETN